MRAKLISIIFLMSAMAASAQTPVLTRALNHGLPQPQEESTLPVSRSNKPAVAAKKSNQHSGPQLERCGENEYRIVSGWKMQSADRVNQTGMLPLLGNYDTKEWFDATVPGTVLTTLVNEGIYPDPYFGLNNMLIPDTLARIDWWYRVEINIPDEKRGERVSLILKGVNYRAEVWFNQKRLGMITGAFTRGEFDVTDFVGKTNVLAVRILPPPNPGIAHNQSARGLGMGPNGGLMCQDGPTFFASEGWDWIPGIRDRNIGLWQDVCVRFHGDVTIGDPQIITDLDLPDTTKAVLNVRIPLVNHTAKAQTIEAKFRVEGLEKSQSVVLNAGESKVVELSPITMNSPRLWWPNGMGPQNLYTAQISVNSASGVSDIKTVRFGVREYEYMLHVAVRTNEREDIIFNPTAAYKNSNPVFDQIDVMRFEQRGSTNYLPRLLRSIGSDGISSCENTSSPYMVLKINGQKVYCKGGNWGMDDAMKRVSRERLEPYMKLQKMQNFNMIRNWTGQSSEEVFYELCDEYGLMVFNDFWMSTTEYNLAPADNRIMMSNVKDAIRRYRNHPSIAVWCARNEGFAPASVEPQLTEAIIREDGTRHYLSTSIKLNTANSGPWESIDPVSYTDPNSHHASYGFKTEVGASSVPTYRSLCKMMEPEDLWPIGDVWSYHDWHVKNWPRFETFKERLDKMYGESSGAEEFCNRAQIENYRAWRAICEASNGKLWSDASGFLLWMSHPSWPSMVWQTYTWDYETTGAYYGCKKACEPIHIQMNLFSKKVQAINLLRENAALKASYTVYSLDGKKVKSESVDVMCPTSSATDCFDLAAMELPDQLYILRLKLSDKSGKELSTNDYWWQGDGCEDYHALSRIGKASVSVAKLTKLSEKSYSVRIKNSSKKPALGVKLSLYDKKTKTYILPVFFSDGYFTMLPGEERVITLSECDSILDREVVVEGLNL